MQFRYLIGIIFFSLFLICPRSFALAESRHFSATEAAEGLNFISEDSEFSLKLEQPGLSQPVDVYLYELDSSKITADINTLSQIYSYYIYSNEVDEQTEVTITISYDGHTDITKTIYFFNRQKNKWEMASNLAFKNNITFKIKGQKNKLVVVGTNLAKQADSLNEILTEKEQVSEIYNFNINPDLSQLELKEVCLPYLNSYFKSSVGNDEEEVKKLQTFLNQYEGEQDLPSTGYYGSMTAAAVKRFQEKYYQDVLAPWDLATGNGWVYKTTLKKINEVYCQKANSNLYQFSIGYDLNSKNAKNAYYLNEENEWKKLESYDNYDSRTVTGIINQDSAKVALFKEVDEWVGEASWYAWKGGNFAASRDFPKGTKLKVTNQSEGDNRGKSVIVTVNDYGPELWTGRIIDLDKVAFAAIANTRSGVMPVKIEVVE